MPPTSSTEELAERVFRHIEKMGIEIHAANLFVVALMLWDKDRCKGYERAGGGAETPATGHNEHDVDT